ncbi:glycosyltransferase family 2 protein [Haloarcula sp. GH36]|uniref:glycosyltransferase family 2 protein n=1 Tax=Haloarcula montana TaxID=3111776 RepID=UPI002D77865A|nr:glycosyltransferase family A protein [Haloarcula sp. GH36]
MPTVSVVIPSYNRATVLPRAIDSALAQTIDDIEVIVVDDASTDNTETVVREYGDRVTYLAHETNKGGSAARNTGIDAADGSIVAFLDSDDEWHPRKLEYQLELLHSRPDEWGAVYCGFRQSRQSRLATLVDRCFERPTGTEGGESLQRALLLLKFAHGGASTLVVRKTVVEDLGGFDESFQRHQDWEFLVRLLDRWKLAHVDRTLVTKHDTGLADFETIRDARRQYLRKFSSHVVNLSLDGYPVVGRHRFALAKIAFANGEFQTGLSYLRHASIPTIRDLLGLCRAVYLGLR